MVHANKTYTSHSYNKIEIIRGSLIVITAMETKPNLPSSENNPSNNNDDFY